MLAPATPGWVSLPVVVCGSPPLLAGVCWRRWCLVCGVWCVVCGVRRWCVGGVVVGVWCGWSVATPGGGSCVLLPATPGWDSLPVVVGVPRHSWRRVPGAVPRHSWLGFAVGGGVWCVVCGVWCVVCGSGVLVGLWLVCGVVGPSPLLAEVPVCYSPPLLAGFRCRWWCAAPRHSWLGAAGCGGVFRGLGCPLLCVFVVCVGVRVCRAVLCVACLWCLRCWWCGVVVGGCVFRVCWCVWLRVCAWVSWPLAVGVVPRHSWLGSTGCGGGGPGCPSLWSWCVCVLCVALRFGVGGVGGGGSCAVWLPCVCVCVLAVCGLWGVSYLGWFSSSVVGMVQKAEEEVL